MRTPSPTERLLRRATILLLIPLGSCATDKELRHQQAEFSISSTVPTDKLVNCIFTGMLGVNRDHSMTRVVKGNVIHITARAMGLDTTPAYDIAITRKARGSEIELRTVWGRGTPDDTEGVIRGCARGWSGNGERPNR